MRSSICSLILTENPNLQGEMLPFFTQKGMHTIVIEKTGLEFAPADLAAYDHSEKTKNLWEKSSRSRPLVHLTLAFLTEDLPLFAESSSFNSDYAKMLLWGEEIAFKLNVDMAVWIKDLDMAKTSPRLLGIHPFMEKAMDNLNSIGKEELLRQTAEIYLDSLLSSSHYGSIEDMGDYPIRTATDLAAYLFVKSVRMEVEEPLENPAIRIKVCMQTDEALFGGYQMCVTVENGDVTGGEM